ncbi:MAG TPA: hypothetical protein VLI90_20650, partial [Tepidisphaeraceae bacterium]|nr:hypothetical protein [Tepidisphaeraceae bacterium]
MNSDRTVGFGIRWRHVSLLIAIVVLLALAGRQWHFVDQYSVNMMCWDQWDDYWPMFRGQGWWACFNFQPGPQRQGAGELLMRCVAAASGWNSRWDSFSISATLTAAAIAAMALVWIADVRGVALIALPLLFFNVRQYQQLVADANVAHGAMPILLLMLYGLAWYARPITLRAALLVFLTFLLIFTGYGIFAGLLTPIVLIVELAQETGAGQRR